MNKEEIFKMIVGKLAEVRPDINVQNISMSDSLRDLGVDSVDRVEIIMMTMESLSLKIPSGFSSSNLSPYSLNNFFAISVMYSP